MTLRYKKGVIIPPLHPAIHHALNVCMLVWEKRTETPLTVTSVSDSVHSPHTLHDGVPGDLRARAIDLRTRDVDSTAMIGILRDLERLLGEAYDIIDEGTHLHIEMDIHNRL